MYALFLGLAFSADVPVISKHNFKYFYNCALLFSYERKYMCCMLRLLQHEHVTTTYIFRNPGYKNLLEYLFWIWDPEVPGGQTDIARILEDGFPDASTYKV